MKRSLAFVMAVLAVFLGGQNCFSPMAASAEGTDITAEVQSASEKNAAYDITVKQLDLPAQSVSACGDGMFRVYMDVIPGASYEDGENYYAFLNKDGEVVLDYAVYTGLVPMYAPTPRYADGVISVGGTNIMGIDPKDNGEYRSCEFYDVTGKPLFEHEDYFSAGIFLEDYAWVIPMEDTSVINIINRKGEVVGTVEEEVLRTVIDNVDGWCGISQFVDGYAAYNGQDSETYGSVAGFIDSTGKKVFGGYTYASCFSEGLACVGVGENYDERTYGFIDETGKLVIPTEYADVYISFRNGVTFATKDRETWGIIDKTGKAVTDFIFDSVKDFSKNGYAAVGKDGKTGYIDNTGAEIIPFEYDNGFGEENGLFTVGLNTGESTEYGDPIRSYGIVDKDNNVVVPLIFDDISTCEEGTVYAVKDETLYLLNVTETNPGAPSGTNALGDLNGDGVINASDAANILIAAAQIGAGEASGLTDDQSAAADVNKDGSINASDAAIVLIYAAAVGAGNADAKIEDFVH